MAEGSQNTDPKPSDPTDGKPPEGTPPAPAPAATDPVKDDGAASGDDEMVTMSKKDRDALVAARDRNHERANSADAFIESMAQERGINQFLKDNAEKYPDITFDDLKHVADPDELADEADRIQTRLQSHAQSKILEIENGTPPTISPEELAQVEKEARDNPGPGQFAKVLAARMRR